MKARNLVSIGICAFVLSRAGLAHEPEDMVTRTHIFKRGAQTYSVGRASGGAQYGVFYGCKGAGRPVSQKNFPGMYRYAECVVIEFHGNGGAWLNSPDGRFFYIQNAEYMGYRIFDIVDIEKMTEVPNLKVPSVPMRDGMAPFGPDPALGEAGFSNSSDTFLAIVPRVGRTELLIYDRPTDSQLALRASLPLEAAISGVHPVDKAHALLWTRTGSVRLYNIEKKKALWTSNIPVLVDGKDEVRTKLAVVSPNLKYALFVSGLGAALVEHASGTVLARHTSTGQQIPSLSCTESWPEKPVRSLPRSPGRCGQTLVANDGVAAVRLESGTLLRLSR